MTMTAPRFVNVANDCKLKCCPNFTDNVKCTEMYIHSSCNDVHVYMYFI